MIDARIFQRALAVGVVFQLALFVAGHFSSFVRVHVLLFGAMMISATAGYIYAMAYGRGFGRGILGGAVIGGVAAFVGLAVSMLLGDTPADVVALWTAFCTLTGVAGGFWGEIAARMTRLR